MKMRVLFAYLSLSLFGLVACGEEEASCPGTELACGDVCVNLDADPKNCGACGNVCGEGMLCVEGGCEEVACEVGEDCIRSNLFSLCFNAGSMIPFSKEQGLQSGSPFSGMEGPQALAALGDDHVVVVGSLDQTLYVVERETMQMVGSLVLGEASGPTSPNEVLVRGMRAFVVNSGTNEIAVVELSDPTKPEVVYSVSTGEGSNPFAAAFDDEGTLWVSLWLSSQVLPITIGEDGGAAGTPVDVAPQGIEGTPFPSGIAAAGEKVYVTLNNLGPDWAPAGNGRLWVYDRNDAEVEVIDLGEGCKNPGLLIRFGTELFIPCGGNYDDTGAVVIYDTASAGDLTTISTGGSPARIAVDPAPPHTLYIADNAGLDLLTVDRQGEAGRLPVCAEAEWEFVADVLVQ